MCVVYCITNTINQKRYVGWTSKTVEKRWKQHIKNAIINNCKFLLSNAIRKYGVEEGTWKLEVLAEVATPDEAKLLEIEHIAKYNTNRLMGGVGYNMTPGGDGTILFGKANSFYGKKHTPETIQKMRETIGDRLSGPNNPQYGMRGELSPNWRKEKSKETRQKLRDSHLGRKASEEAKRNMSIARLKMGFKHTEETKQKMREGHRRRREAQIAAQTIESSKEIENHEEETLY